MFVNYSLPWTSPLSQLCHLVVLKLPPGFLHFPAIWLSVRSFMQLADGRDTSRTASAGWNVDGYGLILISYFQTGQAVR